ncbi:Nucleotide-binding universal stress protein, UspA family [Actinopolymorpha cephalotaxi]|uniref:Nucleotide-binding universal stress UspA family protein n=1 Tax=Actinopolymorpha cephalotaxi TaxID=504797 RepID=A0A1I2TNL6_9ACTN|nr:universal stress protein [Actinopolymorpha cephalotaxi]NYH83161.1 nucleotide-binding universal stress UspA family protein [Actinopolymorpha cephalotaxi]SFG66535.1 Nucleotide-binding universal stress protein, UspA family [Actinopolymorpha cephalotaxi]
MTVLVWVTEDTWPACVAAAGEYAGPGEPVVLAHVTPAELHGAAEGAFGALLGRHHHDRDPATRIDALAGENARELLAAAAERIGPRDGPVRTVERQGRVEREIVDLAGQARLLVCARTGDTDRLGPASLGHATRFVVDHAPCAVLLVWPGAAPELDTLPPPPGHGHEHGPGHGPGPGPGPGHEHGRGHPHGPEGEP